MDGILEKIINRIKRKLSRQTLGNRDKIDLHIEQVQEAVQEIKPKKYPGLEGINPEFIQYSPAKLLEALRKLYQRCLNGKKS